MNNRLHASSTVYFHVPKSQLTGPFGTGKVFCLSVSVPVCPEVSFLSRLESFAHFFLPLRVVRAVHFPSSGIDLLTLQPSKEDVFLASTFFCVMLYRKSPKAAIGTMFCFLILLYQMESLIFLLVII